MEPKDRITTSIVDEEKKKKKATVGEAKMMSK